MNEQHLNRCANSVGESTAGNTRVVVQGLWSIMVPAQMEYSSFADYGDWPSDEESSALVIKRASVVHVVNGKISTLDGSISQHESSMPTALNSAALVVRPPEPFNDEWGEVCPCPNVLISSDLLEIRTGFDKFSPDYFDFLVVRKGPINWCWCGAIRISENFLPHKETIAENWLKTILPVTNEELMVMPQGEGYVKTIPFSFDKGMEYTSPEGIVFPIPDSCYDLTGSVAGLPDGVIAFSTDATASSLEEIAKSQLSLVSGEGDIDPATVREWLRQHDKAVLAFAILSQLPNYFEKVYPLCVHQSSQGAVVVQSYPADNANRVFMKVVIVHESSVCRIVTLRCNFPDGYDWENAVDIEGAKALLLQWASRIRFAGEGTSSFKNSPKTSAAPAPSVSKKTTEPPVAATDLKDFKIEDGVLTWYSGSETNIVIPDGVTEIDDSAFESVLDDSEIESVTIPSSVRRIGNSAFQNCHALKTVVLNEGLEEIGDWAFENCKIKSIKLPSSVRKIGDYAFSECVALKTVVLNEGLEEIGENLFCQSGLKSIKLPSSVRRIGKNAFWNCTKLETVTLNEGLEEIDDFAFYGGAFKDIVLPSSVRRIGKACFTFSNNFESVTLNEGLEEIDDEAFKGCGLVKVVIPSTVRRIGEKCFYLCSKMQDIYVPASVQEVGEMAFRDFRVGEKIVVHTPRGSQAAICAKKCYCKVLAEGKVTVTESATSQNNGKVHLLVQTNFQKNKPVEAAFEFSAEYSLALEPECRFFDWRECNRVDNSEEDIDGITSVINFVSQFSTDEEEIGGLYDALTTCYPQNGDDMFNKFEADITSAITNDSATAIVLAEVSQVDNCWCCNWLLFDYINLTTKRGKTEFLVDESIALEKAKKLLQEIAESIV